MGITKRIGTKLSSWIEQRHPEVLDRAEVAKISPDSLLFYYGNVHSQRGQDGILAEIFRRLRLNSGTFVEFGAWDGVYLSNCRFLFEKGWEGAFIEGDASRFQTLCAVYGAEAVCINTLVGTGPGSRLADLLRKRDVAPEKVTFVSIDVDGPDLEILSHLGFTPPVVLIEGGFNFSPFMEAPLPADVAARNIQQPLPVICATAESLGYVPVCFYQDTYLIRRDLASPLQAMNARDLYRDAYCFMPVDYRRSLLALRSGSTVVRRYEEEFFGFFSVDPLGYADRPTKTRPKR